MSLSLFETSGHDESNCYGHTYDRESDCYLLPVGSRSIFLLAAVADEDQPNYRADRQDSIFHQHQHRGNHFAPLHPRAPQCIDLSAAKSAAANASGIILLASLIMLSIFAMATYTAMVEYERQLAAEARV